MHGTDSASNPRETNYNLTYQYMTGGSTKPHAVTETEDKLYTYDSNGNMTGWTSKVSGPTGISSGMKRTGSSR